MEKYPYPYQDLVIRHADVADQGERLNDIFYFVRECNLYGYADDNTLSKAAKDAASLSQILGIYMFLFKG